MRIFKPQPGPQTEFLSTTADIAVYGGGAGGGKTYALLLEPLRHLENQKFGAVIFRRTLAEVRNEGGLWEESVGLYGPIGARASKGHCLWTFPSGSRIRFRHLQFEGDKHAQQGGQFAMIGFDELTHFSESQFFYLLSRNRSTCGVWPYVRATTNPDANSWVKRFLAPWVDRTFPEPAKSAEVRWFTRDGGSIRWSSSETPGAKSVTFIRATATDNKILLERDPGYLSNLRALPLVDRLRLLEGDWDVVEGGNLFRREWFQILSAAPKCVTYCRYWDLAATAESFGNDPDWTAGVLVGKTAEGQFVVLDVQRTRTTPAGVEKLVAQTAEVDRALYGFVAIRIEQEPGASGEATIASYARLMAGFDFGGIRPSGSKSERARPLSAQSEAGNVALLVGPWNLDFLNELSVFPLPGVHDDQVDAASGALERLTIARPFAASSGGRKLDLQLKS